MKRSPTLRLAIMAVLLFGLHVPLTMMCSVVSERTARRNAVVGDVSANWGGTQTLSGPVLSVPYRYSWFEGGRAQSLTTHYNFLPESLAVDGTVESGERKRTLF